MKSAIVEEAAVEGERVGHHGEAGRADRGAERQQRGGDLGRRDRRAALRRGRRRRGRFALRRRCRRSSAKVWNSTSARSAIRLSWTSSEAVSSSPGHGLAEHDQLLVVDREVPARFAAPARLRRWCWASDASQLVDLGRRVRSLPRASG